MTREDDGTLVDRVVLIALDGLRSDMVTPTATPNIWALRQRGHWFSNARSVFPSYTRVCTASVMTGAPPSQHGIVGNAFHHPKLGRVLDLSCVDDVRALITADGAAILCPTLDRALTAAGRRLAAVNGNSAGTALLMLPEPQEGGHWMFNPHGRATSVMPSAWDDVVARFGDPPPPDLPLLARTEYLGRVFAEYVLGQLDPDVALLWLAEPDTSLHYRGTAHADTQQALWAADAAVGRALDALAVFDRPAERTALLVFSDHGQITCPHHLDLSKEWAGLDTRAVLTPGRCGGITLSADEDLIAAISRLQREPALGLLLSHSGQAGTIAYSTVQVDHPRAPDLIYVLRDADDADAVGLPGLGWTSAGDVPLSGGMHGGLNYRELSNVLLLAHPMREAMVRQAPAGLVDIAPTTLAMLGITPPDTMVGRNLMDADPSHTAQFFEAKAGGFHQTIDIAACRRARYIIRGGRKSKIEPPTAVAVVSAAEETSQ